MKLHISMTSLLNLQAKTSTHKANQFSFKIQWHSPWSLWGSISCHIIGIASKPTNIINILKNSLIQR